eukprot:5572367-Pleurochrysis_carterae.AAC.2
MPRVRRDGEKPGDGEAWGPASVEKAACVVHADVVETASEPRRSVSSNSSNRVYDFVNIGDRLVSMKLRAISTPSDGPFRSAA